MPLNIPVLIRSLGQDMFRIGMDKNKSFRPSIDLLVYLDGNITSKGPKDPTMNVTKFHNAWWNRRSPPTSPNQIFSAGQVGLALEHFRKELDLCGAIPTPPFPIDIATVLNKPAYIWHQSAHTNRPIDCTRCRLYRAVALGVMDQARDIRNMLHACEVSNEGEREVAMRRASGFNELFEAALNKECQTKSKPKGRNGKEPLKAPVEDLKSQMKEIIMLCTSDPSRKWTWGVDLTEADLARLVRGADRHSPDHPHSGYDTGLETMSLKSVSTYSIDASKIEDPEIFKPRFDELSPDFPSIPLLADHQHPPNLRFSMINSSGKSIDSLQPDSVTRALAARVIAIRTTKKVVLQHEVDEPIAEFDADSDPDSHMHQFSLSVIPSRPWLGPSTAAFSSPTSIKLPTADFTEDMDCEIPDDFYVPPLDDSQIQDVEMVGLQQELTEEALVDIWTQDRASITAESIAESATWSDPQIPDTFFVSASDDDDLDSNKQILEPIPGDHQSNGAGSAVSATVIPRDPITGRFTVDSFTSFLDNFMD